MQDNASACTEVNVANLQPAVILDVRTAAPFFIKETKLNLPAFLFWHASFLSYHSSIVKMVAITHRVRREQNNITYCQLDVCMT